MDIKSLIEHNDTLSQEDKAVLLAAWQEKTTQFQDQLKKAKGYGLKWEKQPEEVSQKLETHFAYLTEDESKRIVTDDTQLNHMLIEGDNLESLYALYCTHKSEISVIYIDPPYNTGNKDFIYNDDYVDTENGYRHSKWLSFMERRLKLAKELLSEDGVIFISIDDNEFAQLKLLCDTVFDENNFVANLAVENNPKGRKNSSFVSKSHEHCLVFLKNRTYWRENSLKFNQLTTCNTKDNRTIQVDSFGTFKKGKRQVIGLNSNPLAYLNPSRCFSIYYNLETNDLQLLDEYCIEQDKIIQSEKGNCLLTKNYKRYVGVNKLTNKPNIVTYTKAKILELHKFNNLLFLDDCIYEKERDFSMRLKSVVTNENTSKDILTETAGKKLIEILGEKLFDFPKPLDFVKLLISLHPNKDVMVLDFFAGSGTTGHAVLELNKEDGGNRQFILCTNNENNICEEVTYQRLNKIINGYTTPKGKEVEGVGGNLRYFKTNLIEDAIDKDENAYNLIENLIPLVMLKENSFDIIEKTDTYVVLQTPNKVVLASKDIDSNAASNEAYVERLKSYDTMEKVLYTPYPMSVDEDIRVENYPYDYIEQLKTCNRLLADDE